MRPLKGLENGLAIIPLELKSNTAGQSCHGAIYQLRMERGPKTRLFMFKAGTLVNSAMGLEETYMAAIIFHIVFGKPQHLLRQPAIALCGGVLGYVLKNL